MKTIRYILILAVLTGGRSVAEDYAGITVEETAGIAREYWPVQVGVTVPADASADSLVLVQVDTGDNLRAVPFQLIAEIDSHGWDERWRQLRDIKSFEIAFLTAIPAHASLDFRLYYGEPDADVASVPESRPLTIEKGEGLARRVDTGEARFEFRSDSGQLIKYQLAGAGYTPELLRQQNNPVHGAGDLRTTRNNVRFWDLDDESHGLTFDESSGPITWQLLRSGYMPHTDKQVEINVMYKAFAGMPFIVTSSHIHFHSDWAVSALRKNQLVFDRGFHTHGAYMNHDGELHAVRAFDPESPDTHFGTLGLDPLPPDLPFIGMLHEDRGYGIGLITLDRANLQSRRTVTPQDGGAYYHFLDSSLFGAGSPKNFFYLVCYEAYHGNHHLVIPAGSTFASRTAILAYPVGTRDDETRYDDLKRWIDKLRNPPRVYAR